MRRRQAAGAAGAARSALPWLLVLSCCSARGAWPAFVVYEMLAGSDLTRAADVIGQTCKQGAARRSQADGLDGQVRAARKSELADMGKVVVHRPVARLRRLARGRS